MPPAPSDDPPVRSRPTSFRLTDDDLAKLASLANPGESHISVIRRALDALAGSQRPQDAPAGSTPYAGLALQVNALQARLEALEGLAYHAPGYALPVAQPVIPPPQDVAQNVVQPVIPPPGAYPLEVKMLALQMQDQGQPNRVIAAAILERTGRKPDSKNMGALLRAWRKALNPV